jgi:biotin transport system substrate-specific component
MLKGLAGRPGTAVLADENKIVRDACLVVGGSLLLALCAQIFIPLWFTPVPITGQTLGVLLIGAALGSRRGALAIILYLIEGGSGLPFFAGGGSGWAAFSGPTGGYLIGFVAAAYVVGWLAERGWDRKFWTAAAAMLAAEFVIYLFGVPWLAYFVGPGDALPLGMFPFIPGDIVKLVIAALVLPSTWSLVGRRRTLS